MKKLLGPYSDFFFFLLRAAAALMFLAHGLQKFNIAMLGGFEPPFTALVVARWLETIGGVLILVGLVTRWAGFILSGEMAFAYFMSHAPRNFFPILNAGDGAILYCFIFLYIAAAGGGPWSIDAIMSRDRYPEPAPEGLQRR